MVWCYCVCVSVSACSFYALQVLCSERLPKEVLANLVTMLPHLDGPSYPMRSAIVTTLGNIVALAFPTADAVRVCGGMVAMHACASDHVALRGVCTTVPRLMGCPPPCPTLLSMKSPRHCSTPCHRAPSFHCCDRCERLCCVYPDGVQAGADGAASLSPSASATRDALLDVLQERVRDVHAFTRAAVLRAWLHLCEAKALPLERYHAVTAIVIDRLQDKSAITRKAAVQLVTALLERNPFGTSLNPAVFKQQLEAEVCVYVCVCVIECRCACVRVYEVDSESLVTAVFLLCRTRGWRSTTAA